MRFTGAGWSVPRVRVPAESYVLIGEHPVDPFDLVSNIFQFLGQARLSLCGELASQIAQLLRLVTQRPNGVLSIQPDRARIVGVFTPILFIVFYHDDSMD